MDRDSVRYWVGFSKVPGIGPAKLRALLEYYGDIERAWQANPGELRAVGLDKRAVENLVRVRGELELERELDLLEKREITVLTWESSAYPELLQSVDSPPPVLYVWGELTPQDDWTIAVVGTRRATPYGKQCAQTLARGLAENGITVVSGLAYGIDTAAHKATLDAGGRTIAVLGSGLDNIYPAENRKLAHAISENGAVISEYALGTRPDARNFPRRNRIISGISLGTLVVEGTIKSGACITAKYAIEQGRDVFAIPGTILRKSSSGPNHLIQNGAKLVTDVSDILNELNLTMVVPQQEVRAIIPDNEVEATVLQQLSTEPRHIDELGQATGIAASDLASTLTLMELKGMVKQVGAMNYVVVREVSTPYTTE